MLLPSYEEATRRRDVWELIAPWVTGHEKTVLCRVSKHFHNIFLVSLWSEPTKALLSGPDALKRLDAFIENASDVRPDLRDLVTTMDLRGLGSDDLEKRLNDTENFRSLGHSNGWVIWLCKLNLHFPSLKFILFDGNPSFDLDFSTPHSSPRSDSGKGKGRATAQSVLKSSLALDDRPWDHNSSANNMTNLDSATTSSSLASSSSAKPLVMSAADCRFYLRSSNFSQQNVENLVFLDISGNLSPPGGLKMLGPIGERPLPSLRVLKMRRSNLYDEDLNWMISQVGKQLFSLDVRDNRLTSRSVGYIIPLITPLLRFDFQRAGRVAPFPPEYYLEDTPSYVQSESEYSHAGEEEWQFSVRPDDANGIMNRLKQESGSSTGSPQSHLLGRESQITKNTGLTHLYISGNRFTAKDFRAILSQTECLQVADFGSGPQDIPHSELSHMSTALQSPNLRFICQLRSQDVVKIVSSRRLQNLRIHHSLVTCTPTVQPIGDFYQSEAQSIKLGETECGTYFATHLDKAYAAFLPHANPRLRVLTLTDVPRRSSGLIIRQLIQFLYEAALQELKHAQIARINPRESRHRRAPRVLSGLRVLRLEFVPLPSQVVPDAVSFSSVTGDSDADIFLAESSNDFSFFDETPAPVRRVVSRTKAEGFLDVREALEAYRQETTEAMERERRVLGGACAADILAATTHYHWSGVLEMVG